MYYIFILLFINFLYFKIIIKKNYLRRKKFLILNKKIKPKIININYNKKIIKIDNIIKKPHGLINLFNKSNETEPGINYPGSRFFCPVKLSKEIKNLLLSINEKYYKIPGNIYLYDSNLSVVDFNNNELYRENLIPHRDCLEFQDGNKKSGLALIIYLCNPNKNFSGTKFFEEKLPINTEEFFQNETYKNFNNIQLNYETDFSSFFKELYESKIEFNKCLIYPTNYFHTACLKKTYGESNTIKNRYTITAFIFFDKQIQSNFSKYEEKINNNFDYLNKYYIDGYENDILNSRYKL